MDGRKDVRSTSSSLTCYRVFMGRSSNREQRRVEITQAFANVLADHGYAGATIAAVADEAGVSPGLLHHHFKNKEEMLDELVGQLLETFRQRVREFDSAGDPVLAYGHAALAVSSSSDVTAARCWAGLFAEAMRNPSLFERLRKVLESEVANIMHRSGDELSKRRAHGTIAFIVGALIVGSFAAPTASGFAAPCFTEMLAGMRAAGGSDA